ncbi:UNVERIFIED_CONTAM: hypothetical protein Slati_2128000 [Sesamum latifolium]|uniref:Reverse transcriptase zinc-binding domain-containing protein n=1 Tax=Sesamum latifolium TaxID=2727402 RepID=A0AAW2WRB1_9LAMI
MRRTGGVRLRAYCLFNQGLVTCATGGGTGSTSYKPVNWKFIWKAKVPPKIRMFVWRACRDSLPTVANLARRGVKVGGACPRCGLENEDVLHCLRMCFIVSCAVTSLASSGKFRTSPGHISLVTILIRRHGLGNLALSASAIMEQVRSWEKALVQKHDNFNSLASSLIDVGGSHSNPTGIS